MEPLIIWDLEVDPEGNFVHICVEHDFTQDEIEDVVGNRRNPTVPSDSGGYPGTFGETSTGRYIFVIWEHVDDDLLTIRPITAYEVPRPRSRNRRR